VSAKLPAEDVHYKKTIVFNFWKKSLKFRTSQELFSSHIVDQGTQFLLRTIVEAGYQPLKVLDLGCGYGPAGLTLKKLFPGCEVHLVDRDALALEYTRQNAAINGLDGIKVYPSLGYDDIESGAFDLIVSNIPGKAGEPVISSLLEDARFLLGPSGIAAVVVVSPLEEIVKNTIQKMPGAEILLERSRPEHKVFHYRFIDCEPSPHPGAFDSGVYRRKSLDFRSGDVAYHMGTVWNIPEFDSLDHRTEILLEYLRNLNIPRPETVSVFNPGQGHVPVVLGICLKPGLIEICDRDLLALRCSRLNLVNNRFPEDRIKLVHATGTGGGEKIALAAGLLREEEGPKANLLAVYQTGTRLTAGGILALAASSTAVARLTASIGQEGVLHILKRVKQHGMSLLVLA